MDGAGGLKPGLLQGDILINLDSETEGEFTIGERGRRIRQQQCHLPDGWGPGRYRSAYTVTIGGLQGGHSGVDIDLGAATPPSYWCACCESCPDEYGLRLAGLAGGTAANAIPTRRRR